MSDLLQTPTAAPVDQISQFLDTLFAGKGPEEHILIWLLDGKRSAWFTDLDRAAAFVRENRARDVYVGVALSPKDHGAHLRLKIEGSERMPTSIVGLWSDVDVADSVHKKRTLAPTVEDAKTILFPEFPPSVLLHSGGGLQAWWLFKENWTLEGEDETAKAGALSVRWIRALRARAAAKGWDIDAVGDLTRVLRVPNTSNCKIPDQPRPVRLLEINDRRYNPSDMKEYLDMIGAAPANSVIPTVATGERLQYSADAEPPAEKFVALRENDIKFKKSWDHSRKDLKDQTASAYDMALANPAVQAGWTDQEIANLLIAHRRRYKEDLKLRDSYYAKTISKARAAFPADDFSRLEDLVTPERQSSRDDDGERKDRQTTKDPAQAKAAITEEISEKFGLVGEHRIVRIAEFLGEPRQYAIEIANGDSVRLGEIQNLLDPCVLQNKIAEITHRLIPSFKKNAAWAVFKQALLDACTQVAVGEESTDAGRVKGWLRGYLAGKSVLDSIEQADDTRDPFMRDGRICVYLSDFRRWVHINHGDRIPPKELGILLRRAGVVPEKPKIALKTGKLSTREVWPVSESWVPLAPHAQADDPPAWVTRPN